MNALNTTHTRSNTLLGFILVTPSLPLPVLLTYILQHPSYITSQGCWSPQAAQGQNPPPPPHTFTYTQPLLVVNLPVFIYLLTLYEVKLVPHLLCTHLRDRWIYMVCVWVWVCLSKQTKSKLGQTKISRVLYLKESWHLVTSWVAVMRAQIPNSSHKFIWIIRITFNLW